MDGFVSVMAGTLPAPEFFAPENTERIMRHRGFPQAGMRTAPFETEANPVPEVGVAT